jgi:hypothetical protein
MLRRLVRRFIAFWLVAFCLKPAVILRAHLAHSSFKAAA